MSDAVQVSERASESRNGRNPITRLLIMRGGGVKGLAFAGALEVLESTFSFDVFAGTSAGAIAAVLLAAGLTAQELNQTLTSTDFKEFLDGPKALRWFGLLFLGGLYPGERIKVWIEEVLRTREDLQTGILALNRLQHRAVLFAADHISGTVTFDSKGSNNEVPAPDAVRYSMSIPFFFRPVQFIGRRVYDGGMTKNFPIYAALDRIAGDVNFLALYLGSGRPSTRYRRWLPLELLDVWLNQDEYATLQKFRNQIIVIDTDPIRTTDFDLADEDKLFLRERGRAAAIKHLHKYGGRELGSSQQVPSASEVREAELRAELAKQAVIKRRAQRRMKRMLLLLFILIAIGTALAMSIRFLPSAPAETRLNLSFQSYRDPVKYYVSLLDESPGFAVSDRKTHYVFYKATVDYVRYPPWPGENLLVVAITDPSSYAGWIRAHDVIYREIIGFTPQDVHLLRSIDAQIASVTTNAERIVLLDRVVRMALKVNGKEADLVSFSKEPFGYVLQFRNPTYQQRARSAHYEMSAHTFQPRSLRTFPFGVSELFRNLDYRLDYGASDIEGVEYFSAFLFDPRHEVKVIHDKQNRLLRAISGDSWVYPGGGVALNWE